MKNTAKSNKIAFVGIFSALACSVMIFFSMASLGFGALAVPILCVISLLPVLFEYGKADALAAYVVTSLLCLLLCPDKEPVFVFIFFGWHPVAIKILNELPAFAAIPIKLALFGATAAVMILFMITIFGIDYSFFLKSRPILYSSVAMSGVVYLMLDKTGLEMKRMWDAGFASHFQKH